MPTYEYECESCGHHFERRQAMSDPALTACPACGGRIRRVISGGGGLLVNNPGQGHARRGDGCSLEKTGSTCCGSDTRCATPSCESHR